MTHPWDEVDRGAGGAYVKWDEPGQNVKGTISRVGTGTDLNGNTVPELDVDTDDGDTVTISASQVALRNELLRLLPSVGDTIVVVFTGTEKVGRGDMKKFDVAVKAGDGAASTDEPALTAKPATSAADLL